MNDTEITQKVVGILTQTLDSHRRLSEDPDREDIDAEAGIVGELAKELTSGQLTIDGDASPQEVADAVMETLEPTLYRTIATFAWAFAELASVHDDGHPVVSSGEVLRQIALRHEQE